MHKKLIMACMALVAFAALALPALASAANDPQLTEGTTLVPPGAKIIGTSIGNTEFVKTTPEENIAQVTCNTAHLTGEVTANAGGTLEGTITSAKFQGTGGVSAHNNLPECTAAGNFGNAYITVANLPLSLKSTPLMANDEFQVTGAGGAKVKFIIGSTVAGACEYEATSAAISGTFTTGATTVATVNNTQAGSGSKLVSGSFLCPPSGQLKMSFLLETDVAGGAELGIS